MQILTNWFKRYSADPQVVFLTVALIIGFAVILTLGNMLAPVLASIVVAYLLEGLVAYLQRWSWPRLPAVLIVYVAFSLFVALVLFGIMPLVSRQVTELVQQLPAMIGAGQKLLMQSLESYPDLISAQQIQDLMGSLRTETLGYGQRVLTWSLASVVGVITLLVYLILMPLLVFFFLKDKELILGWFTRYLPKHRGIAGSVWAEVDRQISNYVRGKFWEILIVWAVNYATFALLQLNYAMLLSLLVGLSVIIPFIGASVVTVPVLLVAWFQWGWGPDFAYLAVAYTVLLVLDGNLLVPLLFSEVVNLHPVAIIVAVLVFGGLWGFWGVFFAIPLATLVQAVMTAWPRDGTNLAERPSG